MRQAVVKLLSRFLDGGWAQIEKRWSKWEVIYLVN